MKHSALKPILLNEPLLLQQSTLHVNLTYQPKRQLQLILPPKATTKRFPFLLCLQTPTTPWPLTFLTGLSQKGFACALITLEQEATLSEQLADLHSATRFLILQAYRYQLDTNRYGLLAHDVACQVALQAVLTSSNQQFHKEDVQVLPLFYRSLFLISPQLNNEQLLLTTYKRKTFPKLLIFHGQADQLCPVETLATLNQQLEDLQADLTFYQIVACPHFSDAFYTPYVTDLIATAFTKSLQRK